MAMYRLLLTQNSAAIVSPLANRVSIACPINSGLINGTISQKVKPNEVAISKGWAAAKKIKTPEIMNTLI
jgi:hypothetical protein